MEITINDNGLGRRLARWPDASKIDRELGRWASKQRDRLENKPYPPTRPNQRYIRTYRLKNSWRLETPQRLTRKITNTAAQRGRFYSGFVVSTRQAHVHQGRWWQAVEVITEDIDSITTAIGRVAVKDLAG